ncbi:nitroreductase [Solihabitans fulvus]|uniref:Nitroreductase n=1 Tax=Solihabitans fulvus TaxID=1892852 RepID=A0A5B2XF13_9PSEU|nr:nitroreductase family protein [Solihabitans fulvus]KAA2261846.1 nitroreductase [Solihabitans fulvus]
MGVTTAAALGLSSEDIGMVLEAGAQAPSLHNSQPWRFRVLPEAIELHADLTRRLPSTDPDDRELRLACGAALLNIRLALHSKGVRPLVSLHPAAASGPLAVVTHGGTARMTEDIAALLRAVWQRHTNRRPFLDAPVPIAHRHMLVRAAQTERTWLQMITDRDQRARLQRMVALAHREQLDDPAYRVELVTWTSVDDGRNDGVPPRSAGPAPESQDEWTLRDFTSGQGTPRRPGKDFESEPLIAVLSSHFEGELAQLQAGQAMQRVLLTATALGLAASFLSQVIEVPTTRGELRRMIGGGVHPQTVLRIGFGSPVPAAPRRPVAELLLPTSSPSNCH